MADIDMSKLVKLQALDSLAAKADLKIREVETKANDSFKGAKIVNGNTLALYKTTDTTGTADLSLDFPAEMVLDATKTGFVANFAFNSETYAGATDPDLDGKPVLVLAIKTVDKGVTTTSYSFINVNSLVDIYTAADNSITINGYTIAVKISAAENNAITLKTDGLHVDISGKQDKDTNAVTDNIAKFDANGNAIDGGIAIEDVITADDIAADSDVAAVLSAYFNPSALKTFTWTTNYFSASKVWKQDWIYNSTVAVEDATNGVSITNAVIEGENAVFTLSDGSIATYPKDDGTNGSVAIVINLGGNSTTKNISVLYGDMVTVVNATSPGTKFAELLTEKMAVQNYNLIVEYDATTGAYIFKNYEEGTVNVTITPSNSGNFINRWLYEEYNGTYPAGLSINRNQSMTGGYTYTLTITA